MPLPILGLLAAAAPSIINASEELIKELSNIFGESETDIKDAMELDPKHPAHGKGIGLAAHHNIIDNLVEAFQPGSEKNMDAQEEVFNDYIQLNLRGALKGIEARMELIKMQNALAAKAQHAPNGMTPDGQVAATEPIALAHEDDCNCDDCMQNEFDN